MPDSTVRTPPRVLLADDDVRFCALLKEYLNGQGFEIEAVHDGADALRVAAHGRHDVLVLDVMMPQADGFQVLRQLRSNNPLPVLMLTARGEDVDRIVGLEMGADDYLAKPCNPRELAARLRALLRRARGPASAPGELRIGELALSMSARTALLAGRELALTGAEFDVLRVLVEDAGRLVPKRDLAQRALHRPLGVFDRSIDMHVSRLRLKLSPAPDGSPRIKTVRNRGYLYALPP